jgi:hypothetical protein
MHRRAKLHPLRGKDPTTLEVQLQDLLRRPLGQLEPLNVLDILALNELEEPPKSLKMGLGDFARRMAREVADLPNGKSWDAFIDELAALDAEMVPLSFRKLLAEDLVRGEREAGKAPDLIASWEGNEPKAFEIAAGSAKVLRAPKAAAATKTGAKKPAAKRKSTKKPAKPIDHDRVNLLTQLCMERLGEVTSETGLKEMVLVAGVRHRAKAQYPYVTPAEVTTVLKNLKLAGRVRYSAGRWMRASRW